MVVIYKIENPSGHLYIGQTSDYERRLRSYKNSKNKHQIKLFYSFEKHGFENHIFEIIEKDIPIEHLDTIETYNIWLYDSYNKGLNCTPFGGCVFRGKRHSPESRKMISEGNKGKLKNRIFSEETKLKMSKTRKERLTNGEMIHSRLGKEMSKETKEKIGKANSGKKRSIEQIEKHRTFRTGKKHSKETIEKMRLNKPNKVLNEEIVRNILMDKKNGLKEKEISLKYNLKRGTVSNVYYGYNWKHVTI